MHRTRSDVPLKSGLNLLQNGTTVSVFIQMQDRKQYSLF